MVTKIDRCSRNTLEFLKLQDILFKRKIEFISLDLPHSDDLVSNKFDCYNSFKLLQSLKITDEKNAKNKESGLPKKKESIRDEKQSLIKL
jgi:hypothetical protein